jgi:hypothetical protein
VHIHIYKCIYVSVFALAVRLDVAIAFLYALPAMKRGGCQRCGSVLRGRGVGYCWWCNKHISIGVVTESPGPLWLMSQGALDVPCVDWRIAMHCGASVPVGLVGAGVASMLSESGGDALCVSDALEDMHVSPMSTDSDVEFLDVLDNFDMCVSPISSDSDALTLEVLRHSSGYYEELVRSRVVCALAVLLQSDSLASIFSYCNDYCRLALSSRCLYGHGVFVSLYRYWYEDSREAALDAYIQERDDAESSADMDVLCQSCGLRPADEVLASVECWQCYDEHTD